MCKMPSLGYHTVKQGDGKQREDTVSEGGLADGDTALGGPETGGTLSVGTTVGWRLLRADTLGADHAGASGGQVICSVTVQQGGRDFRAAARPISRRHPVA